MKSIRSLLIFVAMQNVQHGAMLASPLNARDRVLAERERKRKVLFPHASPLSDVADARHLFRFSQADTDRQVAELQALSEEYMEMRSKVAGRGQDLVRLIIVRAVIRVVGVFYLLD